MKAPQNRVFGKRYTQHTIIFASGSRIRHVNVRPWMVALTACFIGVFSIGYLLATTYLVLRDDLIGASLARQARMQHSYEDRIAALRAQVDRVTSRQLLDQQLMEDRVAKLYERQIALSSRHGRLGSLIERAGSNGILTDVPVPAPKPKAGQRRADAGSAAEAIGLITGTVRTDTASMASPVGHAFMAMPNKPRAQQAVGDSALRESVTERADRVFGEVTLSLKNIEREQVERLQNLASDAKRTAGAIRSVIGKTGMPIGKADDAADGVGGPYVRMDDPAAFDRSLERLDSALGELEAVREQARKLPFGQPGDTSTITSSFGSRKDPFLGRLAFHAGVDFRAATGAPVRATGAGTVVKAGRAGGYGKMVEIRHGNGITTRYGHLSRILVSKGDTVRVGQMVGKAGSTGRSTGPHIHYEVRLNGKAIDPRRFLNAGLKLKSLL